MSFTQSSLPHHQTCSKHPHYTQTCSTVQPYFSADELHIIWDSSLFRAWKYKSAPALKPPHYYCTFPENMCILSVVEIITKEIGQVIYLGNALALSFSAQHHPAVTHIGTSISLSLTPQYLERPPLGRHPPIPQTTWRTLTAHVKNEILNISEIGKSSSLRQLLGV
eukprot:TRINITY_DN314_c0_g2_i3.p1 TRINITY_DN314_c0_g2~~TRINITY_DN314_c0_g2_i3.p1  ORF type:complete len:166 (-),score=16.12 TRINITY_DN314_c0_g2_i3:50-547(-)